MAGRAENSKKTPKVKIPLNEGSSVVRVTKISGSFMWTIYNFSFSLDTLHSSNFTSPTFAIGCNNELKWELNLYPFSIDEVDKENISLSVYYSDNDDFDMVLAECEISILNEKGEKAYTIKTDSEFNFSANNTQWNKIDFIKRDFLLDKANGLLINDRLTLLCEITTKAYYESADEDRRAVVHISKSRLKLSEDLKTLLDGKFSDVIFVCNEKEFHLHKVILAARSPVFCAMFEHEMLEKTNNALVITDTSSEAVHKLVQYVYTGTIEDIDKISKEILIELLIAADKYELNDLKEMSEVIFYHRLTLQNAIETLIFADFHNAQMLRNQTIEFIVAHNKNFIDNPEFESFSKSHSHLLPDFIKSDRQCWLLSDDNTGCYDCYYDNNFITPIVNTVISGKSWCVSQFSTDKLYYTWEISNVSILLNMINTEDSIVSQTFSNSGYHSKWQLSLYLNGINNEMKDYISLYLKVLKTTDEKDIQAQYEFCIINSEKKEVHNIKSDNLIFIVNGEKLGEPKFLKKDFLLENAKELLVDDKLILMCKIVLSTRDRNTISQTESMSFCLPKYQLGVSKSHEKLLEDGKFSDITLTCNGKEFNIHRIILAIRCPTFLDTIDQLLKENDKSGIEITDVEPDILKELLLYIYSGTVRSVKKSTKDLYVEAKKYQLESLKVICEIQLFCNLTLDNVCDNFVFAHINNSCKLKNKATQFIISNLNVVTATEGYKSLVSSRPQLLKEIIYKLRD